ncbi:MAG TPA: hypothetical protein VF930_01085 [Stellaceae bacterium]
MPLLRGLRRATGEHLWDARPTAELNAALTERYGIPIETGGKQAGLAAVARALNRGDLPLAQIATLHLRLPNPPDMAKSISSLKAISELVAQLAESGLLKVMWNPEKHPRTGEAPNPGWFAPAGDDASTDAATTNSGGDADTVPVADFSGGFHGAVVDAWMAVLKKAGIPAVDGPAIRIIGADPTVVGYPDIMVHLAGTPVAVFEVKTGADPPFTDNQRAYIPLLQIGGHMYSTDPRIRDLGLEPGVPFPPMPVYVIFAPGPNQPYDVIELPPPVIVP